MIIQDKIYGELKIENQIIEDLIKSKPMQRLKGVRQSGADFLTNPTHDVTRFEHSIGVWWLSKKFDSSIEEQIASLLHDVPHTAFSHVIDFIFDPEKHSFHDKFANKMILESEIPEILAKHKIEIDKVLHTKNFRLLENDLPDISVDRLDYFLRDSVSTKHFPPKIALDLLEGLKVDKNSRKLYFEDESLATLFAVMFMQMSRLCWLSPTSHGNYFLLSEAIKKSVESGLISQIDFWKTDEELWKIIKSSNNSDVLNFIKRLENKPKFVYCDKGEAEFFGPNKPRFVDPWIKKGDELVKLSDIKFDLKQYFEDFKRDFSNLGVKEVKISTR